jgi:hypothetical protein
MHYVCSLKIFSEVTAVKISVSFRLIYKNTCSQ